MLELQLYCPFIGASPLISHLKSISPNKKQVMIPTWNENFRKLKFNLQVKFVRDSSYIKIFEQNIKIVALTYLLVQVKNNNSDKF